MPSLLTLNWKPLAATSGFSSASSSLSLKYFCGVKMKMCIGITLLLSLARSLVALSCSLSLFRSLFFSLSFLSLAISLSAFSHLDDLQGGLINLFVFRLLQDFDFVEAFALFDLVADHLQLTDLLARRQDVRKTVQNHERYLRGG